MQEQTNTQRYEEDEIDLKELVKTLWTNKIKIILVTSIITVLAIVYAYFKNPTPIYSGSVMVEIGEVKSDNPNRTYFDNTYNLKNLIENQYAVEVELPKKASAKFNSNNTLTIVSNNIDKTEIKLSLNRVVEYIINRHEEKIKLYDGHIMTKQIGEVSIGNNPINKPKKKLIVVVAFITGFIFSIFLVFFLEFIRGFKKEVDEEN